MIMKYAVINSSNIVENIIVWDGSAPYNSGEGMTLVEIQDGVFCSVGWLYDPATQTFTDPNPQPEPAPEPTPEPDPVQEPTP